MRLIDTEVVEPLKSCETCIENSESVCTYECNDLSRWKGCPNNRKCFPTHCELYKNDCRFGITKNIDSQG